MRARLQNHYYNSLDTDEARRLAIQEKILREFEADTYKSLLSGKSGLSVLDIGSNNGDLLMNRLGSRAEVSRILGVDIDQGAVKVASSRYQSEQIQFKCCDCESGKLEAVLEEYLDENKLTGFDFVNISLVILHLERPFKVLKTIRKYLNKNASIFVCDVDDSLDLAYPDEHGHFARFVEIAGRLKTTGFRHSGRQVFGLLSRAGYKDIKLEKIGPTTIGMSYEERDAFFHSGFSYLKPHLENALRADPSNKELLDDLSWIEESYDFMEESFHSDDFFFQTGTLIFTARV